MTAHSGGKKHHKTPWSGMMLDTNQTVAIKRAMDMKSHLMVSVSVLNIG